MFSSPLCGYQACLCSDIHEDKVTIYIKKVKERKQPPAFQDISLHDTHTWETGHYRQGESWFCFKPICLPCPARSLWEPSFDLLSPVPPVSQSPSNTWEAWPIFWSILSSELNTRSLHDLMCKISVHTSSPKDRLWVLLSEAQWEVLFCRICSTSVNRKAKEGSGPIWPMMV